MCNVAALFVFRLQLHLIGVESPREIDTFSFKIIRAYHGMVNSNYIKRTDKQSFLHKCFFLTCCVFINTLSHLSF